ncbi:L(+)-tartrate dehydratase subunit beta [Marinomonas posidonica]|uniref:L(+)-tartrate dehydratase subunit beta n=1 Tax=Marinomonas posidonica (strain CECT 7376 / NCIMB 14433 / IVIA-Po-181) TaxID=491952 RepID=F6CYN8_MARPP|nr:L(+)-tartrate dehydratase subunit beta [Marinomonas posidonica]AEF55720.1 hydro-lyase, Fe-S type, tartrate/fumarate subfamily, beta subunit [Marinomonas posidonica IVIA-Po-181]
MKKILTTPISDEALADLNVGDIVYLTGHLVTCRDVAHRRLIELKQKLPVDIKNGAIFHAGPIVREKEDGSYEMVSIGPTTSMRMEKFERQFIEETGVKLIIGKGGMGEETAQGCLENKAVHAVFPGGCAVVAATKVEEIEQAEWKDLGMPETLWVSRVREFGPLIISIDTKGRNIFEENKKTFNERKGNILKKIHEQVKFIK